MERSTGHRLRSSGTSRHGTNATTATGAFIDRGSCRSRVGVTSARGRFDHCEWERRDRRGPGAAASGERAGSLASSTAADRRFVQPARALESRSPDVGHHRRRDWVIPPRTDRSVAGVTGQSSRLHCSHATPTRSAYRIRGSCSPSTGREGSSREAARGQQRSRAGRILPHGTALVTRMADRACAAARRRSRAARRRACDLVGSFQPRGSRGRPCRRPPGVRRRISKQAVAARGDLASYERDHGSDGRPERAASTERPDSSTCWRMSCSALSGSRCWRASKIGSCRATSPWMARR